MREARETIQETSLLAEAVQSQQRRYTVLKPYARNDPAYMRYLAGLIDRDEFPFFMHDLECQCIDKMKSGDAEVNNQVVGVLKGFDLVMANLNGVRTEYNRMAAAGESD